jgi:hypothetical protein
MFRSESTEIAEKNVIIHVLFFSLHKCTTSEVFLIIDYWTAAFTPDVTTVACLCTLGEQRIPLIELLFA